MCPAPLSFPTFSLPSVSPPPALGPPLSLFFSSPSPLMSQSRTSAGMWVRLKRRGVCLELLVREDAVLPPPPASAAGGGRTPSPSPLLSDSIYTNGAAGRRAGAADLTAAFGAPTAHATAIAAILADGVPRRPAAAAAAAAADRAAAVLDVLLTEYVHAATGEPLWTTGGCVAGRALTRQWKVEATASLAAAAAAAGLPVGA